MEMVESGADDGWRCQSFQLRMPIGTLVFSCAVAEGGWGKWKMIFKLESCMIQTMDMRQNRILGVISDGTCEIVDLIGNLNLATSRYLSPPFKYAWRTEKPPVKMPSSKKRWHSKAHHSRLRMKKNATAEVNSDSKTTKTAIERNEKAKSASEQIRNDISSVWSS